ncbi:MAG: 7-cyano-7-deazaguanine synthase QueC [bacterium]|nr:7-cyano-7-deazaguanine synthase QueC [bacterium]
MTRLAGEAAASGRRGTAVVLLSGGLDSCVCLAGVLTRYDAAVLHLDYGQRTQARERAAFDAIADHYGIARRLAVDVSHLKAIGGTSLIDDALPVESGLPVAGGGVPSTYVPFRNGNLLAIAASWAEVIGAQALVIGAVQEDGSGYPDCTEAFYRAFAAAIDAGTRPQTRLEILTPLIHLDKAAIVRRGLELGAPLHLTWSCYVSQERACGRCESCQLRLRGFARAGATDPIPYA